MGQMMALGVMMIYDEDRQQGFVYLRGCIV